MRLSARKLLMFGIKLLLVVILFASAWAYFAPTYNFLIARAVAGVGSVTGATIEVTEVAADLIALKIYLPWHKVTIEYEYEGYFHFNLGLLLALFLATPLRRFSQKLRLTLIALSLMIVFHIVFLVTSASILDPCLKIPLRCPGGRDWYRWLDRFMATSKNLLPVLLWALLTFRYWFPKPTARTTAPAPQSHRKPKEARP